MPNPTLLYVDQGNFKNKSILMSATGTVLYTTNLSPCVAILIVDLYRKVCTMIHSPNIDSLDFVLSTVTQIKMMPFLDALPIVYQIGLIGGSAQAILSRKVIIAQVLKRVEFKKEIVDPSNNNAFLTWDGQMFNTKLELATALSVPPQSIQLQN